MKYLFIELEIRSGEYEHNHRVLTTASDGQDNNEVARQYALSYWDEDAIETDSGIEIFGGEMIINIDKVVEISKEIFDIMSSIFSGNKPKETRVYVLSADAITIDGGYDIDNWNDCEQAGKELPTEAHEFMKLAEERGTVYSLKGFMVAANINVKITKNDYIFITKAY